MELSETTRGTAALLLFSLVTVETGGMYLLRLVRGGVASTPRHRSLARAGHAHAGVLLLLSLVGLLYVDAVEAEGVVGAIARLGVPAAALLMPLGFFLGAFGREADAPDRWLGVVLVGAVALAGGLVALGVALLTA